MNPYLDSLLQPPYNIPYIVKVDKAKINNIDRSKSINMTPNLKGITIHNNKEIRNVDNGAKVKKILFVFTGRRASLSTNLKPSEIG